MATPGQHTPAVLRDAQMRHIKANLRKLVELTILDPLTLTTFTEREVFGPGDIATLAAIPNAHEKNAEFYKLLQTRVNFFEVLVEAMTEGKQTVVLEILNKLGTNGGGTQQDSEGKFGKIVIGRGNFTVAKIVLALNGSEYFNGMFTKWTNIAMGLGSSKIEKLRFDYQLNKLSDTDVIHQIIEDWVGSQGSAATLQKLIQVFENNKLGGCVEILENMGTDAN